MTTFVLKVFLNSKHLKIWEMWILTNTHTFHICFCKCYRTNIQKMLLYFNKKLHNKTYIKRQRHFGYTVHIFWQRFNIKPFFFSILFPYFNFSISLSPGKHTHFFKPLSLFSLSLFKPKNVYFRNFQHLWFLITIPTIY